MIGLFLGVWLALQAGAAQAPDHLQAGLKAQKEGRPDAAIAEFRAALKAQPGLVEAERLLGLALLDRGYAKEAIPHLERARADGPLGLALYEEHQAPDAVERLLSAVRAHPEDPELLFALGKACSLLLNKAFDSLMAESPDSAWAHQLIAEGLVARQQNEAAEKEYRAALTVKPDLRGVHLALGRLRMNAGDVDGAEKEFRAEAQRSPGDGEAAWRLGAVLLQKGLTREALAELERSNKLRPQMMETLYDLGKASALENKPEQAEQAWLSVVKIDDSGDIAASSHLQLSQLYRRQGKSAEADRHLQRFKELQAKPARP